MILSVPIKEGYAYFDAPAICKRSVKSHPQNYAPPIEATAPLLPLGAQPLYTGNLAKGIICYPQHQAQVAQINQMTPPPDPTQPAQTEPSLIAAVVRGLVVGGILELIT